MKPFVIKLKKDTASVEIHYTLEKNSDGDHTVVFTCDLNIIEVFKLLIYSDFVKELGEKKKASRVIKGTEKEVHNAVREIFNGEFGTRFTISFPFPDTVNFFNFPKGLKFIKEKEDNELFEHTSGLMDEIKENDNISFDVGEGNINKIKNSIGENENPSLKKPEKLKNIKVTPENLKNSTTNKADLTSKILKNIKTDKANSAGEEEYTYVNVFYGTDRNKLPYGYGTDRTPEKKLQYGTATVSIPKKHKIGEIERPGWLRRTFLKKPENPSSDICIWEIDQIERTDFLNKLGSVLKGADTHDAFMFIHGYHNSFDEAIRRTAQMSFDLNFKGAALTYSWPSKASLEGYFADENVIDITVPHLKEFIRDVLSDVNIQNLHLIAHSMGNRALTDALLQLKQEGFNLDKVHQVVLAAPDIDAQVFTEVITPGIKGIGQQITLYASSKDKALIASRKIKDNYNRAGESGENIVIVNGVYTVDASKVDTDFFGHGYFAETRDLIMDMHMIINLSLLPQKRKLVMMTKPAGDYWQFPD
jgi:esterase/lipase superfamily enzyme/cold shock CspA family protein